MSAINGVKVIDAKKPVVINITETDIKRGDTKDPGGCAAALAAVRDLSASAARVHIGRVYLKIKDKWVRFQTPHALRSEIIAFDRGGSFAPGEYRLTPVSPAQRLGAATGTKTNKNSSYPRSPKNPRKSYHIVTGVRAHGANR